MKKVGIIGSGVVGIALAKGFMKYGYATTIASRSEDKRKELEQQVEGITTNSFSDTVKDRDIVVLAVKGTKAIAAINEIGIENLIGKIVIDATNPIEESAPENGVLKYFTNINHSLMEQLQNLAPAAHFVKAFSSVGNALMIDPNFESKPTMFICGNDDNAKIAVTEILTQFGWEAEDLGKATAARAIEPLAMLWCIPGMLKGQWSHAFKLLKK